MKNITTLCLALLMAITLAATPAFSAGGKEQGDVGAGSVDQGATGSDVGNAPGADAQGNQVD